MNYKDMPLNQRIEKIGELLAKAAYLCAKKKKEQDVPDSGKNV